MACQFIICVIPSKCRGSYPYSSKGRTYYKLFIISMFYIIFKWYQDFKVLFFGQYFAFYIVYFYQRKRTAPAAYSVDIYFNIFRKKKKCEKHFLHY